MTAATRWTTTRPTGSRRARARLAPPTPASRTSTPAGPAGTRSSATILRDPAGQRPCLPLPDSKRTVHPADEHLVLGGALEQAWRTLTGAPPAGWATSEPVGVPWSPRQLTDLARARAQQSLPTWIVAVGTPGHPAIATVRTTRTHLGVEEHITLAVGHRADQHAPVDTMPELAESLAARHNLATMIGQLRTARADLTAPAHHEPPPVPFSFTLGPDAMADRDGDDTAFAPARLGPAARPALHYTLGDGTDPAAWERLRQINGRLAATGEG
ncbi:DUF6177 family protein [Streptomyces sp. NPDC053813]|uniref:DUF6177 family protein n=1 Tax=Streptomyces sp. NPDC053813 TaxID=3365717 RepID=UPI0037CE3A46